MVQLPSNYSSPTWGQRVTNTPESETRSGGAGWQGPGGHDFTNTFELDNCLALLGRTTWLQEFVQFRALKTRPGPCGGFRRREHHAYEVASRHRAGSGEWENPKLEGTKCAPGLPVVAGPP